MAARKYDYAYDEADEGTALRTCLHDQPRLVRTSATSISGIELGTATRAGVVPISRTMAPAPPTIPRAGTVPAFVVGERISAFALHAPPRNLPIRGLIAATVMFLAFTVIAAIAYYR